MSDGGDDDRPPSPLAVEYVEVNGNFRMLADIRFKLLALVPALGGAAIYMLSTIGDSATADGFASAKVILVGVMGFVATLGITFYDQRNSELYNALIDRANFLEGELRLPRDEAADKKEKAGEPKEFRGQFGERPGRNRLLLGREALTMSHDKGLALIYGTVLGGWFFPIVFAAARLWYERPDALRFALVVTTLIIVGAVAELIRQDKLDTERRKARVADLKKREPKRPRRNKETEDVRG